MIRSRLERNNLKVSSSGVVGTWQLVMKDETMSSQQMHHNFFRNTAGLQIIYYSYVHTTCIYLDAID